MHAVARVYPEYAAHLKEHDLGAQFRPRGSDEGLHASPDLTVEGKNRQIAERAARQSG